jgi:hypothetical protein
LEKNNLKKFIKGWFIGDFSPSLLQTKDFEISIKRYNKNDYEKAHYHKISTEYTIIIEGEVKMNGNVYSKDDIIIISPEESSDFLCLEDTVTCVIKTPSLKNDKFIL